MAALTGKSLVNISEQDWKELKARVLRLRDLAGYYTPNYAMPDLQAAWADVNELLGAMDEDLTRARYAEGQLDFFGELPVEAWPI